MMGFHKELLHLCDSRVTVKIVRDGLVQAWAFEKRELDPARHFNCTQEQQEFDQKR